MYFALLMNRHIFIVADIEKECIKKNILFPPLLLVFEITVEGKIEKNNRPLMNLLS